MHQRNAEQQRQFTSRKFMFVQPQPNWPRPPGNFLTMETLKVDESGKKMFTFRKSDDYQYLMQEFNQVQASMDIGQMIRFIQKNFYHHEGLLHLADFLRLQGKFTDAFDVVERCIFAFEYAFTFEF